MKLPLGASPPSLVSVAPGTQHWLPALLGWRKVEVIAVDQYAWLALVTEMFQRKYGPSADASTDTDSATLATAAVVEL